jgi:nucleotidyltransferase AbiEii toxin of type IV toxin-antitoxin system
VTPPAAARDTPAGRAYHDLRNLARRDRREPAEYFTLFALEGFLARLAASEHADQLVLKGGVLMAAFAARRPTRDIDLAAAGFANDISEVESRIRAIVTVGAGDGLMFDPGSVAGQQIRDGADYSGVRVKVAAHLATARIALHVDVNFGDPIWPAPTEAVLPLLLGGTLRLRGYPDHMVLAEKIVTALDRGDQNTRWRDFVDIVALTQTRWIRDIDQRNALEAVARYRQVELRPLQPLLVSMPDVAQRRWLIWRRKQRLEATTSEHFADLLVSCVQYADPVLDGSSEGLVWDPHGRVWVAPRTGV